MTTLQTDVPPPNAESAAFAKPVTSRKLNLSWLLIILAIVAGVCFRFADFEEKVFWQDEVYTQFVIAPRIPHVEEGRLLSRDEMLQAVDLDKSASVVDVVKNLANNAAEQTPLYYVLARAWADVFGNGPFCLRLLSAIFGVLLIGASYLLGAELFESKLAGGFAAALVALSPFHLINAGQARPYAFWALTVTLASVALLRATRQSTFKNWLTFAVALTVSAYAHLFSLLFIAALCAWVLTQKRWSKGFLLSLAASFACLAPWLTLLREHITQSNWLHSPTLTASDHLNGILYAITKGFEYSDGTPNCVQVGLVWLLLAVAFAIVLRKAPRHASTFVTALFFVPALLLFSYALYWHIEVTAVGRYSTLCMIAASVCVAGALALVMESKTMVFRAVYAGALLPFLFWGLSSSLNVVMSRTWQYYGRDMARMAKVVNRQENPIVVCTTPPCESMVLCYLLKKDARLMIRDAHDSSPLRLSSGYFKVTPRQNQGTDRSADPTTDSSR